MSNTHKPAHHLIIMLTGVPVCIALLFSVFFHHSDHTASHSHRQKWNARIGSSNGMLPHTYLPPKSSFTFEERIAQRMQKRIAQKVDGITPSIYNLSTAVEQRQQLLKNSTTVTFKDPSGEIRGIWEVSFSQYPSWLLLKRTLSSAFFYANTSAIADLLEHETPVDIIEPVNIAIKVDDSNLHGSAISKVTASDIARSGESLNYALAASSIGEALLSGEESVIVELDTVSPSLENLSQLNFGSLQLFATGRSNFKGSSWGRRGNVLKALNDHVNNTVVAPGEDFSFNGTLNGPVTLGNGWKMAKVIYNGKDLKAAAGGGICQASTTVYRAIVKAGFPVKDRRSHSLYVSYYKKHGLGIDAAIYPGTQDLVFTNDTNHHILIQAYADGDEAVVNIYGTPDGRSVELAGPYFYENAPEDLLVRGRKIHRNEIAWVQQVLYPDGRRKENVVVSRYKTIPNSLRHQYAYGNANVEL